jgi:hypothetical protein
LALLGQDVVIFIFSNMAAVVRAGQTSVSILSYLVHQQRISSGSGRTFFKSPNNANTCPSDCEKTLQLTKNIFYNLITALLRLI